MGGVEREKDRRRGEVERLLCWQPSEFKDV